jgi:uncharacterized protein YaaR (DUF327 family)
MLKGVDSQQPSPLQAPKPTAADLAAAQAAPGAAIRFAQQLQSTHHRVAQESMVAFLAEIDDQGKKLLKHPIRGEIARYRALVGKFVKEAMAQMTTMEKHTDRRNRVFTLVKEIDKKLAELTEMLISGQGKQLEILAKLEEIQGMLVDLKI